MKPRTKLQVEVFNWSQRLYLLKREMLALAKEKCLEHKGFATKSRVICMDCGQRFSPDLVSRKRAICPHCGAKLKVEKTRKTTDKQHLYLAKAEIHGEFQVIRNFEVYAYYKTGKDAHYFIQEILQHWIKDNGKREVVGLNHSQNWYVDSWNGYMEIRNKSFTQRYDVYPYKIHPDSEFLPAFKRYGIDYRLKGLTPLEAMTLIPKNPRIETLLKEKQYKLLEYCSDWHRNTIDFRWPSIKICMRNNYKIQDLSMWFDYLDLLEHYHKDLHNAHYVCPPNLKKAHDDLVAKKNKDRIKEEKERNAKKLLEAKEYEKEYERLKSKFFGIDISDGEITIQVLKSIDEFKNEADAMHHCVFACGYYKKPDSLILSAHIGDKRIETVEVSLKTFDVVQSRAVCNGQSEYHNHIIDLVKKNMNLIKKAAA